MTITVTTTQLLILVAKKVFWVVFSVRMLGIFKKFLIQLNIWIGGLVADLDCTNSFSYDIDFTCQ